MLAGEPARIAVLIRIVSVDWPREFLPKIATYNASFTISSQNRVNKP